MRPRFGNNSVLPTSKNTKRNPAMKHSIQDSAKIYRGGPTHSTFVKTTTTEAAPLSAVFGGRRASRPPTFHDFVVVRPWSGPSLTSASATPHIPDNVRAELAGRTSLPNLLGEPSWRIMSAPEHPTLNIRPVTNRTKTGNIQPSAREREAEASQENRSRFRPDCRSVHVFEPRTNNSCRTLRLSRCAPAGFYTPEPVVGSALSRLPRRRLQHSLGRRIRLRNAEHPEPCVPPPGTQPPRHELRRVDGRAGSAPLGIPAGMGNVEPVPHLPHQTSALNL